MKKTILIICLLIGFSASAQKKKKNSKVVIEVDGVCLMCKKRIEKAALNSKGVKFASWDLKTHQLSLIIDENKTGTKIIQQNIAAVGHDTKGIRAKDHAYNQIDPCCKYRDKNVVESHKN
jgi:mercuric ion binding protein